MMFPWSEPAYAKAREAKSPSTAGLGLRPGSPFRRDALGLGQNHLGMSLFVAGLVLIVIGTGHFKPNVSVMVGALYPPGDARRDGAFTIFYMGINLGAFICAFVCVGRRVPGSTA